MATAYRVGAAAMACILAGIAGGCAGAGAGKELAGARALMKAGRLREACDQLEGLTSRAAEMSRGRQLTTVRRFVECLSRIGELDRAAPTLAGLAEGARLYGRALAAVALDPAGLPRALALLARAGRAWPDQAEIPYRRGVLLLADDQAAAALPELERAGRLQDTAAIAAARAHALLDLGRTADALEAVRAVVKLRPTTKDIKRGRALVQRVTRRAQRIPPAAEATYREALDLLERQDRAGACIQKLEGLLLDHPNLASAHRLAGLAHLRLGNAAEAVVALRRAAELAPLDATAPLYLAVIYHKRGQLQLSADHYRRALRQDPFLVQAAQQLGRILLELKQPRQAAEVLEQVIALDGGADGSRRLAARAHLAAGALHRAEQHLVRLIRRSPEDFELNLRLGQVLLRRSLEEGRPELLARARRHARKAASARPGDAEVQQLQAGLKRGSRSVPGD